MKRYHDGYILRRQRQLSLLFSRKTEQIWEDNTLGKLVKLEDTMLELVRLWYGVVKGPKHDVGEQERVG